MIDLEVFTEREIQVIQSLMEGKSTRQIALQLGICTRAIERHLAQIYEKLDVCCRTEATIKLIRLYENKQFSVFRS